MLCGALILMLLAAPLGATLCGSCTPGQCLSTGDGTLQEAAPSAHDVSAAPASDEHGAAHGAQQEVQEHDASTAQAKAPPCHAVRGEASPAVVAEETSHSAISHEAPEQTVTCHGGESSSRRAFSCCSTTQAPTPDLAAAPAGPIAFAIHLEASFYGGLSVVASDTANSRHGEPPPHVPRSLQTLHSVFLI